MSDIYMLKWFFCYCAALRNFKDTPENNRDEKKNELDVYSKDNMKNANIKRINIFIHGSCSAAEEYTRPAGPKPSFTGLYRNIREQFNTETKVKNLYEEKNKFAENKNRKYLFEKNKFPLIAGLVPGLHEVTKDAITEKAFNFIYTPFINDHQNDNEISFAFNWDGDLSEISRKFAGQKLRESIIKLNNQLSGADIYCYAHSHGGNVLLNSMRSNSNNDTENYKIRVGYLFGTPIGEKTEDIIKNITTHRYDKIINVFSYADYVQTGDVTFSWGKLPKRIIRIENKNIKNIELRIDKKAIVAHEDFFLYHEKKHSNSALVRFFHDFDKTILTEKNEDISTYSLNTSTGIFTRDIKQQV